MELLREPFHQVLITTLSVSLLTLCCIPSTALCQSGSDPVLLSGRLTLGINSVRTSGPPENTQLIKYGFQVYFKGPGQSKLLIESTYSFWQAGEPFPAQTGWAPPQWPPIHTKGNSVNFSSGLRLLEWSVGSGMLTPLACLTLCYQTEKWAFEETSWSSAKHSELRIGGEFRLHFKTSSRQMAPILELGVQWSHAVKEYDDWESLMNRRAVFGALLIPVGIIDDAR